MRPDVSKHHRQLIFLRDKHIARKEVLERELSILREVTIPKVNREITSLELQMVEAETKCAIKDIRHCTRCRKPVENPTMDENDLPYHNDCLKQGHEELQRAQAIAAQILPSVA